MFGKGPIKINHSKTCAAWAGSTPRERHSRTTTYEVSNFQLAPPSAVASSDARFRANFDGLVSDTVIRRCSGRRATAWREGHCASQGPRSSKQAFRKGGVVHQAVDKGSGKRLKRVYAVKQSVAVPKRVPFRQAVNEVMQQRHRSTCRKRRRPR